MQYFTDLSDPVLIELIRGGAIGIIPTDTVYGLVADARSAAAVSRLYNDVKNRGPKPGTLIAADIDQLVQLGLRSRYLQAVNEYWPSSLSVIIPCGDELFYLHRGKDSLAVRIPADLNICQLLEKTGPLLTTSANHPGEPTATTLKLAEDYFDDRVDFYVDGGDLSGRPPSTIIRIVDDAIEILRAGAVKIDENGRITK